MNIQNICIVGLGYIGLPTAALLANKNFNVFGVDVNNDVIETINQGLIHIVEPSLDEYVSKAFKSGKLKAYKEPQTADIFMICVPTPFHRDTSVPIPNIDFVMAATDAISKKIMPGNILILESTSPVGTTEKVKDRLIENGIDITDIYIAYCPERVLPGNIMKELVENDRIIGGITEESTFKVANFYSNFVDGNILQTNARTAEMCKLAENSFRDINIAYANELSMICDDSDIKVNELINLANHHPRVNILNPGVGVGGHCISVDPWFIVSSNPEKSNLIKTARLVNNSKPDWVVVKIQESLSEFKLMNVKITCLGLAFKPDIDDLRESPALYVANKLSESNISLTAVEPNITTHNELNLESLDEAIKNSDIICCLVAHKEFKNQINDIKNSGKLILDFCGLLD